MKHRLDSAYWYMDTHFVDLLLDGVLLECQAQVLIWVSSALLILYFSLIAKPIFIRRDDGSIRQSCHQGSEKSLDPASSTKFAGYTEALQRIED